MIYSFIHDITQVEIINKSMKIERIEKTFKTKCFKWLKESAKQIKSENEVL